jgi:hypothetical protein
MPDLAAADEAEAVLMRLSDAEWSAMEKARMTAAAKSQADKGPVLLGDPQWDALEREAWEEERRG